MIKPPLWQAQGRYNRRMTADSPALDTLLHPFLTGDVPWPVGRALFMNAQAHPALKNIAALDATQDFYPHAQALSCVETPAPPYDAVLVLLPKDKTAAQYDLATALEYLATGGLLVAAAANDANGNRVAGWFTDMGLEPHSLSKHKARSVWAVKGEGAITPFEWLHRGQEQQIDLENDVYWTRPGLFGWDKIDAGSALLAAHLPEVLFGKGADFGCGYGYLTRAALTKNPAAIISIDADRHAVDVCAKNNPAAQTRWADLTQNWDGDPCDWIVMNPPFHMGKMTDADIGLAFIRTAAQALKKNGWLYMVANRHLPYEQAMSRLFTRIETPTQTGGFKLIFAQK